MNLAAYGTTLALISAAPGPVVSILILRALSGETRWALLLTLGIALGQVLILLVAASGLGLWLSGADPAFAAAKALGIAYLCWIAIGLWRASGEDEVRQDRGHRPHALAEVGAGLVLSLSNPLTLLFFLSLLPTMSGARGVAPADLPLLVLLTLGANGGVHAVYVILAARLQHFLFDPFLRRRIQRGMAALLGCATVWLAVG